MGGQLEFDRESAANREASAGKKLPRKPLAIGDRFGRLVVSGPPIKGCGGAKEKSRRLYPCRCDCGGEIPVDPRALRGGNTKSCGCIRREKYPDSTRPRRTVIDKGKRTVDIGDRFGLLAATGRPIRVDRGTYKSSMIPCRCDCGRDHMAAAPGLRNGDIKSCGCDIPAKLRKSATTHGQSKSKIYKAWQAMLARCYHEKYPNFSYWGGRGIRVCDEWKNDFSEFYR